MSDQLAEQASASRDVSDRLPGLVVDPGGDEPFQPGTAGIEDAERCVPGPGEFSGHMDDLGQHGLRVKLGHQTTAHIQEAPEARLIEMVTGRIHEAPTPS